MIKTLQNLQASIKSDFGNLSDKILTMDKTLNDVKTTVNQANDKATDALRIANEAHLAAINVNKKLSDSELKIINMEQHIKSLEASNEDIANATDNLQTETTASLRALHSKITNNKIALSQNK